jgi:hypothetical protein
MQRQALTVVKLIYIDGQLLPGLLKWNEIGYEEDGIEVAEQGFTGMIGSGQEKTGAQEVEWLIKRDTPTLQYHLDWRNSGKEARDIVLLSTDKTGLPENAFMRELLEGCELGMFKTPDFDQATKKAASFKVSYFPRRYSMTKI